MRIEHRMRMAVDDSGRYEFSGRVNDGRVCPGGQVFSDLRDLALLNQNIRTRQSAFEAVKTVALRIKTSVLFWAYALAANATKEIKIKIENLFFILFDSDF